MVFDLSLVAKIFIFQSVNFDYFSVKNDYLGSKERTCWIVRVEFKESKYFYLLSL